MVLIIAEERDLHALTVYQRLKDMGEDVTILDSADYPTKWKINFFVNESSHYEFVSEKFKFNSKQLKGIWNRRTRIFQISTSVTDPNVVLFSKQECRDILYGFLQQATDIINPVMADFLADRKPYQLQLAKKVGFKVPATLISNSPEQIKQFFKLHDGNIIFKVLSNTPFQFTETRLFQKEYFKFIDSAVIAPTIFQEYINPQYHLRITVIDNNIFTAKITTTATASKLDWRLQKNYQIEQTKIPVELESKILLLQKELGLRYGAMDFVVDNHDEIFFLENNPGGQFLFVEIHSGYPISIAIANALRGL